MTPDHTDDDHHGERPKNVPMIIASIAILLLLASLDQTIVSTALPTIVSDLGGLEHLSWVVTAYILSSTVVAPLYGTRWRCRWASSFWVRLYVASRRI
jgi:MFS family permease